MNSEKMKDHEDQRSLFLSLLTLEYGIYSNQTGLEWLKSAEKRLQSGDYSPVVFQMPNKG
jgi:hypothetical protein